MDPRDMQRIPVRLPVYSTLLELERATAPRTLEAIEEMAVLAYDALSDAREDGDVESACLYDLWLRAMQNVVDDAVRF